MDSNLATHISALTKSLVYSVPTQPPNLPPRESPTRRQSSSPTLYSNDGKTTSRVDCTLLPLALRAQIQCCEAWNCVGDALPLIACHARRDHRPVVLNINIRFRYVEEEHRRNASQGPDAVHEALHKPIMAQALRHFSKSNGTDKGCLAKAHGSTS